MRIALGFLLLGVALAQPGPFPKSDPASAFAELKLSVEWPKTVMREDWSEARVRIGESPAWQSWLTAERALVDEWIEKRRDHTEWAAGWWHDFVSPKDGSFLTWTPDEPGESTLSSPSDARVPLTPKLHAAWVFGFRGRHAGKIVDAARLYRLTGESRYAEWAASQLDFYASNLDKWPLKNLPDGTPCCRLAWQSLDEAVNLVRYVTAARVLDQYPSEDRRRLWIDKLFRPEALLLDRTFQRIHNIACWQRSAMGHVALYAKDDDLWRRAVDAQYGIRNQVARGITGDYFWFEQSLGYNQYVVSALEPFFYYTALAGRADSLKPEMAAVGNLLLSPISIRFPSVQLPNPADSTGGLRSAPSLTTLASFYRLYPTPLGLAEAARLHNWDTLLDPPVVPAQIVQVPAVHSTNLESTREAILRSGPWQVFFHYGQLDRSHAQAEALNFEAAFESTDITHDPGTVGYGSPLHREFYTRGLAHNVPLIDGEGQQGWDPGTLVSFSRSSVSARQDEYRPGISASRTLALDENRLVDVVTLEPRGDTVARRLGLALHLQGEVDLPVAFQPDLSLGFNSWENLHSAAFERETRLNFKINGRIFRLTLRASAPFRLWWGRTPDVPPARRDSLYLETRGSAVTFETTIEPTP